MNISKNRLNQIKAITEAKIDTSDIPELDDNFWQQAKLVMPKTPKKVPISLRIDHDVLRWFKDQGQGYQSRINAVLAAFMRAQTT
jgi:uncharacterized protein (DUF4415 family)